MGIRAGTTEFNAGSDMCIERSFHNRFILFIAARYIEL